MISNNKPILTAFLAFIFFSFFSMCKAQDRENSIINIIRSDLSAANQNNFELFHSSFNDSTHNATDTESILNDLAEASYLINRFHGGKVDSLYWTSDRKVNFAKMEKYDVILFNGFDSLTGYKKVVMSFYFWSSEYGNVKAIADYKLNFEVDSDYRRKLREAGKLPDIHDLLRMSVNKH